MLEWIPSYDVSPFLPSYRKITQEKITSSSTFDYFQHDLVVATKLVIEGIEQWHQCLENSIVSHHEDNDYFKHWLNSYESLPPEPKRERWAGFIERHDTYFQKWVSRGDPSLQYNMLFQKCVECRYAAMHIESIDQSVSDDEVEEVTEEENEKAEEEKVEEEEEKEVEVEEEVQVDEVDKIVLTQREEWYLENTKKCTQIELVVYNKPLELSDLLQNKKYLDPSLLALLIAVELRDREEIVKVYLKLYPHLLDETTSQYVIYSMAPGVEERWTLLHHAVALGRLKVIDVIMEAAGCLVNPKEDFDSSGELLLFTSDRKQGRGGGAAVTTRRSGSKKKKTQTSQPVKDREYVGDVIVRSERWSRNSSRVINRCDISGRTPVMLASIQGHPGSLSRLIYYGADLNLRCKLKFTALHWLCGEKCLKGHVQCADLLTRHSDTLVHATDDRGLTALIWANAEQVNINGGGVFLYYYLLSLCTLLPSPNIYMCA
jgi:hypothetical protein